MDNSSVRRVLDEDHRQAVANAAASLNTVIRAAESEGLAVTVSVPKGRTPQVTCTVRREE